jgi:lysozyme
MHIGHNARALIHHFEGHTPYAYNDPVGFCTAGPGVLLHRSRCTSADFNRYGTRARPKIRPAAYELLFAKAMAPREAEVERLIGARAMKHTSRHEFGAMVSLAYNIGTGAFATSTVLKQHKAKHPVRAGAAFLLWNKAGGRTLLGLSRRRRAERRLYRTGKLRV